MSLVLVKKARVAQVLCIAAALLAFSPVHSIAGGPQASATPVSVMDPPTPDPRSLDQRIADAIEFRSEFGFTSDLATVSTLFGDRASDYSFGAPLSTKELANMQHRLTMRHNADAVVAYIDRHPDDFGGVYFTQDTGDLVMRILPTDDIGPGILDEALALIPDGLETKIQRVKQSTTDLAKAEQRLLARSIELKVNEVAIQVEDNNLELVMAPASNASLAAAIANVPVVVSFGPGPQAAACTNSSSCTPYRGGIGIFSPQANEFCTWGFYATRGTSAKYLVTAGHCANLVDTETHLNVQVTDGVDRNTFDIGTSAISDTMTAHVRGSVNAVSPFNTIYASSADKAHPILARKFTAQKVGDAVCFMGGATGTSLCGSIEALQVAYTLERSTDHKLLSLTGQIRMSRVIRVGDSGGPVYQGSTAWGIANALAGGTQHLLYSPITSVESDMNITICVLSAC